MGGDSLVRLCVYEVKHMWFIPHKLIYPLARIYWFIFRPSSYGAKCMVIRNNEILFIRHSYGDTSVWTFPGGGIKRGETPEDTARRETKEEVGIEVDGLHYLGKIYSEYDRKKDTVHCFVARSQVRETKINAWELSEARWFSRGSLPKNISNLTQRMLAMNQQDSVS